MGYWRYPAGILLSAAKLAGIQVSRYLDSYFLNRQYQEEDYKPKKSDTEIRLLSRRREPDTGKIGSDTSPPPTCDFLGKAIQMPVYWLAAQLSDLGSGRLTIC